jgi:peptide deformylase
MVNEDPFFAIPLESEPTSSSSSSPSSVPQTEMMPNTTTKKARCKQIWKQNRYLIVPIFILVYTVKYVNSYAKENQYSYRSTLSPIPHVTIPLSDVDDKIIHEILIPKCNKYKATHPDICGLSAINFGQHFPYACIEDVYTKSMIHAVNPTYSQMKGITETVKENSLLCRVDPIREMKRSQLIDVEFYDYIEKKQKKTCLTYKTAMCFQHHIDILNGISPCNDSNPLNFKKLEIDKEEL